MLFEKYFSKNSFLVCLSKKHVYMQDMLIFNMKVDEK